jgi:hypothetical protein
MFGKVFYFAREAWVYVPLVVVVVVVVGKL